MSDITRLQVLACTDSTVRAFLDSAKSVNAPVDFYVLVEMVEALSKRSARYEKECIRLRSLIIEPPMIVIDKDVFKNLDMTTGVFQVNVREVPRMEIYFMDFIKSWWRRLTRPQES